MPCGNEIMPLRGAVEEQGKSVKAAIDRKADPATLFQELKQMTATEGKFAIPERQSIVVPDPAAGVGTGGGEPGAYHENPDQVCTVRPRVLPNADPAARAE